MIGGGARFDSSRSLDEEFGVTHTKQGIRPSEKLRSLLTPEIEKIAHKLNARVREKFSALKYAQPSDSRRSREPAGYSIRASACCTP